MSNQTPRPASKLEQVHTIFGLIMENAQKDSLSWQDDLFLARIERSRRAITASVLAAQKKAKAA